MNVHSPVHLVMVESNGNHNKYYDMIPCEDGIKVVYGREDSKPRTCIYPIQDWNRLYNSKVRKGYVDMTELVIDTIETIEKPEYKPIPDAAIAKIVERLQSMARQTIEKNYKMTSNKVTIKMVEVAQGLINQLMNCKTVDKFNDILLELFRTIPRKMAKVQDFIASNPNDFSSIIQKEQDLLDVMENQVKLNALKDKQEGDKTPINNVTILESIGLKIEPVTESDVKEIKKALGSCASLYKDAWKVTNIKRKESFDEYCKKENIKNIKLLCHGSRNENWWGILNSGLVLKPTNAIINGKMFGYGIYFAPEAKKSLNYTSIRGAYYVGGKSRSAFMALNEVAYGVPFDIDASNYHSYNLSSFNYEKLKQAKPNANCLHAHADTPELKKKYAHCLYNDEIIVYKEEQTTLKYLIELEK